MEKGFVRLKTGDEWAGTNKADLINEVLGTDFKQHMQSGVPLERVGLPGVVAWFVNLDGKERGHIDDWRWVDTINDDGTEIEERCVSFDKTKYNNKMKRNLCPSRLVFMLDPYGVGNDYTCRFLGYFQLVEHKREIGCKRFKKTGDEVSIWDIRGE